MMQRSCRQLMVVVALALAAGGCGGSDDDDGTGGTAGPTVAADPSSGDGDGASSATDAPTAGAAEGAVTLIAVGDSLTAGDGDDSGAGFVGRLAEAIRMIPGRDDVSVVNLGASGWDSAMVVSGEDGASPGQLGPAVDAVEAAVAEGRTAVATVLIGSNDMWYLYAYGPPEGTPSENEDAAAEAYRANLDRTVGELTAAGAVVIVGLPDDQSLRPVSVEIERLQAVLPDVTADEVEQMSAMSVRLGGIAEEVAAVHGAPTVNTNAMFWADAATMADDGIHPNEDGYRALAELWLTSISLLL